MATYYYKELLRKKHTRDITVQLLKTAYFSGNYYLN